LLNNLIKKKNKEILIITISTIVCSIFCFNQKKKIIN